MAMKMGKQAASSIRVCGREGSDQIVSGLNYPPPTDDVKRHTDYLPEGVVPLALSKALVPAQQC
jgi:hypothetical protein